jgi:general secretion pathway protein G
MPTFEYDARNRSSGQRVSGAVDAVNRVEAIRQIEALGHLPVKVVELRNGPKAHPQRMNGDWIDKKHHAANSLPLTWVEYCLPVAAATACALVALFVTALIVVGLLGRAIHGLQEPVARALGYVALGGGTLCILYFCGLTYMTVGFLTSRRRSGDTADKLLAIFAVMALILTFAGGILAVFVNPASAAPASSLFALAGMFALLGGMGVMTARIRTVPRLQQSMGSAESDGRFGKGMDPRTHALVAVRRRAWMVAYLAMLTMIVTIIVALAASKFEAALTQVAAAQSDVAGPSVDYVAIAEGKRLASLLFNVAGLPLAAGVSALVFFLAWIHGMFKTLALAGGPRLRYYPALASACFLLPGPNLVIPYLALRELSEHLDNRARAPGLSCEGMTNWWYLLHLTLWGLNLWSLYHMLTGQPDAVPQSPISSQTALLTHLAMSMRGVAWLEAGTILYLLVSLMLVQRLTRAMDQLIAGCSGAVPANEYRASVPAAAACVLGLLQMPTLGLTALPAAVVGFIGRHRLHGRDSHLRGFELANAGILLGIPGFLGTAAMIWAILWVPDTARDAAKARGTRAMLEAARTAIEMYEVDNGTFPEDLTDLVKKPADVPNWNGPYVRGKVTALRDAWGHELAYRPRGSSYEVRSHGADGVESSDDIVSSIATEDRQVARLTVQSSPGVPRPLDNPRWRGIRGTPEFGARPFDPKGRPVDASTYRMPPRLPPGSTSALATGLRLLPTVRTDLVPVAGDGDRVISQEAEPGREFAVVACAAGTNLFRISDVLLPAWRGKVSDLEYEKVAREHYLLLHANQAEAIDNAGKSYPARYVGVRIAPGQKEIAPRRSAVLQLATNPDNATCTWLLGSGNRLQTWETRGHAPPVLLVRFFFDVPRGTMLAKYRICGLERAAVGSQP